ncbi:HLH-domain-containing protein [Hesseltinella vesiculosa]|uniref:HLH-domain-containing protein n=1 Tax=Hesseltinella vesiculosa TaxID=101127 RepID=A0A1X2GB60_9FUNG|nr:HLH-domain-containing protein [Hesseltinella vesiculosa]
MSHPSPLFKSPQEDSMDYDNFPFMSPMSSIQDMDELEYTKKTFTQSLHAFDSTNSNSPDLAMHLYEDFAAAPHLASASAAATAAAVAAAQGYVGPMDIHSPPQRHSMYVGSNQYRMFDKQAVPFMTPPSSSSLPMSAPANMGFHPRAINMVMGSPHSQHAIDMPPTTEDDYTRQLHLQNIMDKKRRRRESHNAVERRRRENINDRIQELGSLLPEDMMDEITTASNGHSPTSPTTPLKPNKGAILRKSVDHIRLLQQEVASQKQRVRDLEALLTRYRIPFNTD